MPVRLGQFYALVLLLACLATNIAFFAEVREPFLGDDDPLASVKTAFSDLDIQAKIAEFYPAIQSKVGQTKVVESKADDIPDVIPHTPPEKEKSSPNDVVPPPMGESPVPKEQRQPTPPADDLPVEPTVLLPTDDPFPTIVQPPTTVPKKEIVPQESEAPQPAAPNVVSERSEMNRQTAAVMPKPVAAVVQPALADQFKPIIAEPKPTTPVRPSATPVWDTIDTVRDRPIRYD